MSMNKLTKIPPNDLPGLRDLFVQYWPKHVIGYYTIDNFVKWFEQDPNYADAELYCLDGDWSDGTYVILVSRSLLYCHGLDLGKSH